MYDATKVKYFTTHTKKGTQMIKGNACVAPTPDKMRCVCPTPKNK